MKKIFKAIFLWQLLEGCMIRGEEEMIRYPADENASFGYCVYKKKEGWIVDNPTFHILVLTSYMLFQASPLI